jgi:hypothetical protein
LLGLTKLPEEAVQITDDCPSAVPVRFIVSPAQAFIEIGPALTRNGCTGAAQPLLIYVAVPEAVNCTIAPSPAVVVPLESIKSDRS